MIPDEPRAAVAAALRDLERRLATLSDALAHDTDAWVRVDGDGAVRSAMSTVCTAYTGINLEVDDAPGASLVCLGVVGTSRDIVALAASVNAAKATLRAVCAPLQRIRMRVPASGSVDGPTRALPLIRVILRSLQRSELNLLAAYRRVPVLGGHPKAVVYTRARTRSVYRKRIADIAGLLETADGPRAVADRARLTGLPGTETHLALVRDHYENIRANVSYDGLDPRGRGRVQVAAELPLLYAQRRGVEPPQVVFPAAVGAEPNAPRLRRSKLEPRPLLESLPVYRYLPEFR